MDRDMTDHLPEIRKLLETILVRLDMYEAEKAKSDEWDIPDEAFLYQLCYIDGNRAYFASVPPNEVWGDDWNDAPYEHNAGRPYNRGCDLVSVVFLSLWLSPADRGKYCAVQTINEGYHAWLAPGEWDDDTDQPIFAGITLAAFRQQIQHLGGVVGNPTFEARREGT